jgi:hypothetical protein
MEQAEDIAAELQRVQLAAAQIDLRIKQRELETKPNIWTRVFSSPAFTAIITAAIAAAAALGGATISGLMSDRQIKLERAKFELQAQLDAKKQEAENLLERIRYESALVVEAVSTGDPKQAAANLKFLVDVGFLPDHAAQITSYSNAHPDGGKVLPVHR